MVLKPFLDVSRVTSVEAINAPNDCSEIIIGLLVEGSELVILLSPFDRLHQSPFVFRVILGLLVRGSADPQPFHHLLSGIRNSDGQEANRALEGGLRAGGAVCDVFLGGLSGALLD